MVELELVPDLYADTVMNLGKDKQFNIGSIPVPVTEQHHFSLKYWQEYGLKDAELLHIDAHSDTGECSVVRDEKIIELGIGNFISAAVYLGIVSSGYWLNPHSRRLVDLGSSHYEKGRPLLKACARYDSRIIWGNNPNNKKLEEWIDGSPDEGNYVRADRLKIVEKRPFILDIDLDAFCCVKGRVPYRTESYNGRINWKTRLERTANLLRRLQRKPDLITVTRSQGDEYSGYVPRRMVDKVERATMDELIKVYG